MEALIGIVHLAVTVIVAAPWAVLAPLGVHALHRGRAARARALARAVSTLAWLSLIPFLLGFVAAGVRGLPVATPWILWSIGGYAVAYLLSLFVLVPRLRRGAERLAEGATDRVGIRLTGAVAGAVALLLVAVVVLVVRQP